MESASFYRLRSPSGLWYAGEVFMHKDLAVRAARVLYNTPAVEVWRTSHMGAGIYVDKYVTLVCPAAERWLAEAVVIEV